MKRLIIVFVAMICCSSLMAQPKQQPRMGANGGGGFTGFQIEIISKQLQLSEKQMEPFRALYTEYSEKMNELQHKPHKRGGEEGRPQMDREQLSDDELERQIIESFDMVDRNNALKREYYYKFKEIISVQQIMKMYNIERRVRERMLSESTRRSDH